MRKAVCRFDRCVVCDTGDIEVTDPDGRLHLIGADSLGCDWIGRVMESGMADTVSFAQALNMARRIKRHRDFLLSGVPLESRPKPVTWADLHRTYRKGAMRKEEERLTRVRAAEQEYRGGQADIFTKGDPVLKKRHIYGYKR